MIDSWLSDGGDFAAERIVMDDTVLNFVVEFRHEMPRQFEPSCKASWLYLRFALQRSEGRDVCVCVKFSSNGIKRGAVPWRLCKVNKCTLLRSKDSKYPTVSLSILFGSVFLT